MAKPNKSSKLNGDTAISAKEVLSTSIKSPKATTNSTTKQQATQKTQEKQLNKNQKKILRKKLKKKKKKLRKKLKQNKLKKQTNSFEEKSNNTKSNNDEFDIVFVSEKFRDSDGLAKQFKNVFDHFTSAEDLFKTKEQLEREAEKLEQKRLEEEKRDKARIEAEDPIMRSIKNIEKIEKKKGKEKLKLLSNPDLNDSPVHTDDEMNKEDSDLDDKKNNEALSDDDNDITKMSNFKKKQLFRPSLALLKQHVSRADLVEENDVNAPNPLLLVKMKSIRNTVPVPQHWLQKRKYLQGKRGYLKPPFKLPDYIEATGISKIRDARLDTLSDKSLKQKQREKMRPKGGGININYSILHDAFFKHSYKPTMSNFGDLYYEGKEFEKKYEKHKPGYISDELKKALGLVPRYKVISPHGALVQSKKENPETNEIEWNDVTTLKYGTYVIWEKRIGKKIKINSPVNGWIWLTTKDEKEDILKRVDIEDPPPWLINMQRFGPPPSYPDLKIPGLNAPIPPNKMYGFHEGQWGKPPVDETGQPLYGDPFGIWTEPISRTWSKNNRWGLLQVFSGDDDDDDDSDDESEDDSDDDDDDNDDKMNENIDIEKLMQNSKKKDSDNVSLSSYSNTGLLTPDAISLRKKGVGIMNAVNANGGTDSSISQSSNVSKEFYQILKQKRNDNLRMAGQKFGSDMIYEIPNNNGNNNMNTNNVNNNDILRDAMSLKRKYEQELEKEKNNINNKRQKLDNDDDDLMKF